MSSPKKEKPTVHKELKDLEIQVNEFGEVVINKSADELNTFLNKNVKDKKLEDKNKSN